MFFAAGTRTLAESALPSAVPAAFLSAASAAADDGARS
ncbi:hypothetical protein IW256_006258 [Actinomadura viridis]|uniref:Uncharacterized protein n=1 Tax=Actinomadura viridis TaxID=58110 RepID=A0A931DRM0_9ACTN|nr:hypothetical protein [Actinomadura viridis]